MYRAMVPGIKHASGTVDPGVRGLFPYGVVEIQTVCAQHAALNVHPGDQCRRGMVLDLARYVTTLHGALLSMRKHRTWSEPYHTSYIKYLSIRNSGDPRIKTALRSLSSIASRKSKKTNTLFIITLPCDHDLLSSLRCLASAPMDATGDSPGRLFVSICCCKEVCQLGLR